MTKLFIIEFHKPKREDDKLYYHGRVKGRLTYGHRKDLAPAIAEKAAAEVALRITQLGFLTKLIRCGSAE